MIEFRDKNAKNEPDYFYEVSFTVTTGEGDEGKSFSHVEKFEGRDLKKCRKAAEAYYYEKMTGFENGTAKFFLPYAAPEEFELGKNATHSIELSLIEYYNEDKFYEYPLLGQDEETTIYSHETEEAVFKHLGL